VWEEGDEREFQAVSVGLVNEDSAIIEQDGFPNRAQEVSDCRRFRPFTCSRVLDVIPLASRETVARLYHAA